jgi:hypothetical protein
MPLNKDWLPQNHRALKIQASQTYKYLNVTANQTRMGITGAALDFFTNEFTPKFNDFTTAFEAWQVPAQRTPIVTDSLYHAKNIFKPAYRQMYMAYLKNNPLVTDTDLDAMGLPKRISRRIPVPIPESPPAIKITLDVIRCITIHFFNAETMRKAKPKGAHGAEITWIISAVPITDLNELIHSSFSTRSPFTLEFKNTDRGKYCYFALRWENTRGQKGLFSEIESTIIP